jgi:UDP-GlcNAc:undecaprenyl-phosphate/decaprenyl-phosphate GlcNAc-1-phosphate transferase
MILIASFATAFIICLLTIILVKSTRFIDGMMDLPNHRSLHTQSVPRIGGIGITVGVLIATLANVFLIGGSNYELWSFIGAFCALSLISLVDDSHPLPVQIRLPAHVIIIFFWALVNILEPLSSMLVSVPVAARIGSILLLILGVTWATNLYNFMDGSDGLAGGMSLVAFSAYLIAAIHAKDENIALLCATVCGAAAAFLRFNWPPAKVFLGDCGSIPLGFLAAAIGTIGVAKGHWNATFPLILFAMFWVDATYTLVKRAINGKTIWLSHREHWYQKAIQAGNTHKKVMIIHFLCNVLLACVALATVFWPVFAKPWAMVLTMVAALGIVTSFGLWSERQFRRFKIASAAQ